MIESTLDSELMALRLDHRQLFVSLLSYVVVDEKDPAFQRPSKPIGPAFAVEAAGPSPLPHGQDARLSPVVASPEPVPLKMALPPPPSLSSYHRRRMSGRCLNC